MALCLNASGRLVHHAVVIRGTVDRAPFYPREILKAVLLHDATKLILVHNHPGGNPTPSENDRAITRKLEALAGGLGIEVLDHLVVTPRAARSLKTGWSCRGRSRSSAAPEAGAT
jgi:DNA repair protein RadC